MCDISERFQYHCRITSAAALRAEFAPEPTSAVPTEVLSRPFSVARSLMSHPPFCTAEGVKPPLTLIGSGSGTEARGVVQHVPGGVPDVPP